MSSFSDYNITDLLPKCKYIFDGQKQRPVNKDE